MVVYLRKSIHSLLSVFKKKAGPKGCEEQKRLTVHYTASQHYQENVFIEGSRPQYLKDLHTEAQEGLKILQQEEHKNEVNFSDDESIASTDTLRQEQDISSKDGGGSPESRSTFRNTHPTEISAVLNRPALTRQGSTFKPLNPVKRLEKSRKRSRRTTIMGIPSQVQKELALHRISTFQPLVPTHLPNPDRQDSNSQSGVITISTLDGGTPVANKEGARVHLSELEAFRDEHLVRKHLQEVYQDEQSFSRFNSQLCPTTTLRPKSLAVPGITTSSTFSPSVFNFLQEPQGPVMSISPQATYLSTIIPNAVLPASVEVIEIDRSNSRSHGSANHGSSILTVSKSNLTSGESSVSPLLSRRSDDDSSQTSNSHNNCLLMPTSASGSNWSELKSSKVIISDSSPVSSKDSTRSGNSQRVGFNVQENQAEQSGGEPDHVSLRNSVINSPSSKSENLVTASESSASGSVDAGEHAKKQCNKRSLSVMKTKQPPAPPRRTNSLHGNKIRGNSRFIVDNKDLDNLSSGEVTLDTEHTVTENGKNTSNILTPASNSVSTTQDSFSNSLSPASNKAGGVTEPPPEASTSSPQKTSSEGEKFERTMSPSSGYSSQSGTPTLSPKGISPTSPEKLKKKPVKPERSVSRTSSSAASPSSSLTSLSSCTSEVANPDISTCSPNLPVQGPPPTVATKEQTPNSNHSFRQEVKELLNIPPPPKVKAPCPPPPETWAHNRCTFELLCGPRTVNKVAQKPAQIQESASHLAEIQPESKKEIQVLEEHKMTIGNTVSKLSENEAMTEALTAMHPEAVHMPQEVRECSATQEMRASIHDKGRESIGIQRQEQSTSLVLKDPESEATTPKKEPPPVMKKPMTVMHKEETVLTEQSLGVQQREMSSGATTDDHLPVENPPTSQKGVTVLVENRENEMDKSKVPLMQTPTMDVPKMNKVSPPPTPPPAYQPTPPLSRKSPPSSVSMPPKELHRVQEEMHVVESSWPPPPPPLEGDSVFDGGDEVDFPPPPPPFIAHSVPDVDIPHGSAVENPDFPSAISHPVTTDNKSVATLPKANTEDEISCQLVQNFPSVSDNVSTPESPPLLPITSAESTVSTMTAVPPSSFLKRSSLKIDDQSLSVLPFSAQTLAQPTLPAAPPLPAENLGHGVSFRRQPSVASRDARSKEVLSRHKNVPIPKEDANIPLVTPSLLQMVRLRSVNMTEDQVKALSEDKSTNDSAPVQENGPVSSQGPQNIPQKPVRKSLSLKSPPQTVKTSSVTLNPPSLRLQEAIRMKTAAMSLRDGLPSRLGVIPPMYSYVSEPGALSLKSPEGCNMYKSPASTASFIFSRSTKKVVRETAGTSSPETQASLKQNLAAELMKVSDQSKATAFSNGGLKCDKVPPPVAKKPAPGSISPSQNFHSCPEKMENNGNGTIGAQYMSGIMPPETTTIKVTADTIETLF